MPYVSLQYAQSWLEGGERWEEHRPAVVHRPWSKLIFANTIDPATDIYHSHKEDGDTTVVVEVHGLNHIEICSNAYLHREFIEPMVQRVIAEAHEAKLRRKKEVSYAEQLRLWWEEVMGR